MHNNLSENVYFLKINRQIFKIMNKILIFILFLEKKIAGLLNKKNFKFSLNLANTRKVEL